MASVDYDHYSEMSKILVMYLFYFSSYSVNIFKQAWFILLEQGLSSITEGLFL